MVILTGLNFENLSIPEAKIEKKIKDREILPETSTSLAEKYPQMSLDEFQKADTVLQIYSHVLGETVYFASNQKAKEKCGTLAGTVYSTEELRYLIRSGMSQKDIKAINDSKKVFSGNIQ